MRIGRFNFAAGPQKRLATDLRFFSAAFVMILLQEGVMKRITDHRANKHAPMVPRLRPWHHKRKAKGELGFKSSTEQYFKMK